MNPISHPLPSQRLYSGNGALYKRIQELVGEDPVVTLYNTTTDLEGNRYRYFIQQGRCLWERDLRVFNPFSNQETLLHKFKTTGKALAVAKTLFPYTEPLDKLPQVPSHSVCYKKDPSSVYLEGGNVLFWSHSGKQGAIIGVTSILFTMDKMNASWEQALEQIAKELKIPVENLICLEHNLLMNEGICIHIDLTVLLGPGNTVFLNSAHLCQMLDATQWTHPERAQIDEAITHRNKLLLEKQGFRVILVPGYFAYPDGAIYFLNGLLFQQGEKHVYLAPAGQHVDNQCKVTPSSSSIHTLAENFSSRMHQEGIDVVYANLQEPPPGGSIHCLTSLIRTPSPLPPQSIFTTHLAQVISTPLILKRNPAIQCCHITVGDKTHTILQEEYSEKDALVISMDVPIEGAQAQIALNDTTPFSISLLPGHPRIITPP